MNTLEDVYSEWLNNPEFREEFKKNPQAALEKYELKLSAEDLKKIQSMLKLKKQKGDEELDSKISK